MKKIAEAWSSLSLIKRIIIGLVIGALLGAFGPKDLAVIEMLGTLFVSALKAVAPFLVFSWSSMLCATQSFLNP